jgi:TonB family protein
LKRNPTFLVLGAFLAAACGTAAARSPLELSPWDPPRAQACGAFGGDFPLSAIMDSAAAAAAAEPVIASDGGLLLSVGIDTTGARSRFRAIETTLPAQEADALASALEPLVRGRPGAGESGRMLVERTEGRIRLAVGPSESCRPAIADPRETKRALEDVYRQHRREGSAHVRLHVDTAGLVDAGHIERGTGDPVLDAAILDAGRRARFHPALIDRQPVAVWVALDLVVEVACPPADSLRGGFVPHDDPCHRSRRGR